MNMFKSRRKAKDQSDALEALTYGQSSPAAYKPAKGLRRKNRDMSDDSKPAFDLSTALPGTDEFRTSLLMPNLSARFSMLREQDDPNTKLGKASDDSVLFPKRVSRLNLFGPSGLSGLGALGGLSEVPENDSTYSTFRPPFADRDRSNSFGDGYDSDNGSVMNRSRAGHSNTLFGGRQKTYRIPNSSTKITMDASGGTIGQNANEQDTSLSQFQQYRTKEKEAQLFSIEDRLSIPAIDTTDSSETASPATTFSKNRGTHSSTNSAPKRISTAATSLISEPQASRNSAADSVSGKSNDLTLHAPENQSSITVPRLRDDPIPNRFQSPPRVPIKDRTKRPSPVFSPPSLRNASSPPVMPVGQGLDFGFNTDSRSTSAAGRYQSESPPPNQTTETGIVLANNVQPNDRGKATALGLFNKPAREFNEHQFNQRQIQMHEENVSSMSTNSRSTSQASNEVQRPRQNSLPSVRSPSPVINDHASASQIPPVPSTSGSPIRDSNRASRVSSHSTPSRPRSKSSISTSAISSMKARVESLIRRQNAELAALEVEKLGSAESLEDKENFKDAFSDNDDDDASEYEEYSGLEGSPTTSANVDESNIHPAFRNSYRVSDTQSRRSNFSNLSKTRSVLSDERNSLVPHVPNFETDFASPSGGTGLSGLIRTHLRQNSDKSSIFLRPQSIVTPTAEPSQRGSISSTSRTAANSLRSDPFDLDSNQNQNQNDQRIFQAPSTPNTAMSQAAHQFLSKAMAMKVGADNDESRVPIEAETEPSSGKKVWHEDLERKHQRGGSSETTKERREFDEELAERRRKIREGLKSVTEHRRSQSPANATKSQNVIKEAFTQPRVIADPQPKAMKMLGLQTRNGQTGPVEDDRGRTMGSKNDGRNRALETTFNNNQVATFARFGPQSSSERHDSPRSGTPPTYRQGARDRSNSAVGDRSKSRNRHKEVSPPVPNDYGYFGNWNQTSFSPSENPHSNADPSTSKTSHLDTRSPPSDLMTTFSARSSTKPSPMSPQNPYDETVRASSGVHSSGRTTPSNGRTTPTSGFNRKRSVTKTMISEPKFVSSTSSVPLVHLPAAQAQAASAPPLPQINPRRRGNTGNGEKPILSPTGSTFSRSTPLETVPASPVINDFNFEAAVRTTNSPSPRKLRKATSEGGSMAAKSRQHAVAAELAHEKARSPPIPVFPNRSATVLGAGEDGGMF